MPSSVVKIAFLVLSAGVFAPAALMLFVVVYGLITIWPDIYIFFGPSPRDRAFAIFVLLSPIIGVAALVSLVCVEIHLLTGRRFLLPRWFALPSLVAGLIAYVAGAWLFLPTDAPPPITFYLVVSLPAITLSLLVYWARDVLFTRREAAHRPR